MADWTEAKDPASGKVYYYNSKTGATSWDKPAGFGAAAAGAGGWQEAKDPSSGKTYWYNAATGQTTWENPNGGDSLSARKQGILAKRGGAIAKKKSAAPQTVGEKLVARSKKFVQLRKTEKAKANPSAFSRKRGSGSKAGAAAAAPAAGSAWQAVTDPNTGQTYYFNPTTNETSWTLPA